MGLGDEREASRSPTRSTSHSSHSGLARSSGWANTRPARRRSSSSPRGRGQRGVAQVVAGVEVRVVDPHRPALAERGDGELLAVARARGAAAARAGHELVVRRRVALEHQHGGDVHVRAAALEVRKEASRPVRPVGVGHAPDSRRFGGRLHTLNNVYNVANTVDEGERIRHGHRPQRPRRLRARLRRARARRLRAAYRVLGNPAQAQDVVQDVFLRSGGARGSSTRAAASSAPTCGSWPAPARSTSGARARPPAARPTASSSPSPEEGRATERPAPAPSARGGRERARRPARAARPRSARPSCWPTGAGSRPTRSPAARGPARHGQEPHPARPGQAARGRRGTFLPCTCVISPTSARGSAASVERQFGHAEPRAHEVPAGG